MAALHENDPNRILTELLPHIAAQLRGSLGNINSALHCMVKAEARDSDPLLDQNTAILAQSYYHVLRLVNNLSAAPLLAEEELFALENTEVVEWLGDLCRQAEPLAEVAGITLTFQTELRAHVTAIHPGHLERLVWNLLSNALKATPQGGEVTVMLRRSGAQLLLVVSDTGCGISPEKQEGLFERYLHAEGPDGMGLGLPLCRRIAQGHGGNLLLQSREGEGTTVTVALPDRRTDYNTVQDVPFHYAGGFQTVMMELSDALPYRAYLQKYLDE